MKNSTIEPPYRIDKENGVEYVVKNIAEKWRQAQAKSQGPFLLASPLSSTPLPLYEYVAANAKSFTNWENFCFVMMDEMCDGELNNLSYVPEDDLANYTSFAYKNLIEPLEAQVRINLQIYLPPIDHLEKGDKFLSRYKGLDLLILAIGENGHFAQITPGTPRTAGFHIADLYQLPGYKERHEQGAYKGANFRRYGMSLGYQQVFEAKEIIVMITGKKKSLTEQLLSYKQFDINFPLSIITDPKVASKTTVIIDKNLSD